MKNWMIAVCAAALVLPCVLTGCNREISRTKSTSVSSDGTVKSKEKTVTETPAGTVTKTEESKTTAPKKP
jgi:hypothetical protein